MKNKKLEVVRVRLCTHPAPDNVVTRQIIESFEDLDVYEKQLEHDVEKSLNRFITFKGPDYALNHAVPSKGTEKSLMSYSLATSEFKGSNPLFELGPAAMRKLQTFRDLLERGRTILINEVGGYSFKLDDDEIIERNVDVETEATVVINNGSEYIVLENDMTLDKDSDILKYDKNPSFVFDLRHQMEKRKLKDILTRFADHGGKSVYVYTTGLDKDQIDRYLRTISFVGQLSKVVIEFSDKKMFEENLNHIKEFLIGIYDIEFFASDSMLKIVLSLKSKYLAYNTYNT